MLSRFLDQLSEEQLARLASKIDVSKGQGTTGECWEWKGAKWGMNSSVSNKNGYGVFTASFDGKPKSVSVHRLMMFLVNRPFDEKLEIKHSCDHSICCKPDHLEPGTRGENIAEAWKRKRMSSTRPQNVSDEELKLMISKLAAGDSIEAIAESMGRNRETVRRALVKAKVYTPKSRRSGA